MTFYLYICLSRTRTIPQPQYTFHVQKTYYTPFLHTVHMENFPFVPKMSFIGFFSLNPGFIVRLLLYFLATLFCSLIKNCPQHSLFFHWFYMTLACLKSPSQLFYRMSLNLDCLLMIRFRWYLFPSRSWSITLGTWSQFVPLLVMLSLMTCVVKVISARLQNYCKCCFPLL